jgi:hypothetical protein
LLFFSKSRQKELGVRDLNYRLIFLAYSVIGSGGQREEETPESMKEKLKPEDWNMMTKMSNDPKIYQNICDSIFPHVHGSDEIKKGSVLKLAIVHARYILKILFLIFLLGRTFFLGSLPQRLRTQKLKSNRRTRDTLLYKIFALSDQIRSESLNTLET